MFINLFFIWLLVNKLFELGKSGVSVVNTVIDVDVEKPWENNETEAEYLNDTLAI